MSQAQILVLGAIAGLTIFLGLPAGRARGMSTRTSALLSAIATGILLFLLWDVLAAGIEPVETALTAAALEDSGSWARFAALAAIFVVSFTVGLMSLVYFNEVIAKRRRRDGIHSVGAAAIAEYEAQPWGLSPAQSLSLMIAAGIGLHNFSEGLAIGQSAASGAIDLALVLVIGFGLHNATEGFGIVGPFSGTSERPSWALPRPCRPDRRRPDLLRDTARPDVGQRGRLDCLPRPGRRLDPLRRRRASGRLPQARPQAGRRLGAHPRPDARLRHRLRPRRRRRLGPRRRAQAASRSCNASMRTKAIAV